MKKKHNDNIQSSNKHSGDKDIFKSNNLIDFNKFNNSRLSYFENYYIDKNEKLKLKIELIPKTSWGNNLRSKLSNTEWEEIRKRVIRKAGHKCEICGFEGDESVLHCHEKWSFNEDKLVQKLENLQSLCPRCHNVKHIGRSTTIRKDPEVIKHFKEINNIDEITAKRIINSVSKQWMIRSNKKWKLDISYLKKFNIKL